MADKLKVAVIGLGPTGAFAARAASDLGCEVDIYVAGSGGSSTPPGAFWLHWIPDGVVSQGFIYEDIWVEGKGTPKAYIERQWGKQLAAGVTSSFPVRPVWERGYNPQTVLEKLIPRACEEIRVPYPLSGADIRDLSVKYDLVFQTFPTKESFEHQPALLPFVAAARFGSEDPSTNWVVYNGTPNGLVVREAVLFGNHFLEFPKGLAISEITAEQDMEGWQTLVLKDLHPHTKPWSQDPASKVKLVGRLAMWDRKFLSHDAYAYVQKQVKGAR